LVSFLGDFDLAEEAVQDAFTAAAGRWPRDGTPANPGAWRPQPRDRPPAPRPHAHRKDAPAGARSEARAPFYVHSLFLSRRAVELIFTCCHPALGLEAQVALTLRALGGLRTDEIARAFLVPEQT
jgi:RNA polymerase sigma-70 factor, ECF subfamily